MVIGIFGESCVGKSTLADQLAPLLSAEIFTGKDYLRLAKSEAAAKAAFQERLNEAMAGDTVIYVITEKEHLSLLPEGALRVLVTAQLETIQQRFAARMHGNLPPPVKQMLERSHGKFDQERCDLHMKEGDDVSAICEKIAALVNI